MHAACTLTNAGLDDAAIKSIVRERLTREPRPNEIEEAIYNARRTRSSFRNTSFLGKPYLRANVSKRQPFDASKLAAIAAKLPHVDEGWLIKHSPIDVENCSPEVFLHKLFKVGEKVRTFSSFKSQGQWTWQRGESPQENDLRRFKKYCFDGAWFLSNPCDGLVRRIDRLKSKSNPQGRSCRAEENITSFRYAVIESDEADPRQWLAALVQMPLPIVSIVTSGGRSLHSLVRVNAESKTHWDEIVRGQLLPVLTVLGADPGSMTAVRLTRLPGCLRYKNGDGERYSTPRMQKLLFLNPEAVTAPVADLPETFRPTAASVSP